MRRSRRGLSEEDRRLWDHVRQTAEPLRPEPAPPVPPQQEAAAGTEPAGAATTHFTSL